MSAKEKDEIVARAAVLLRRGYHCSEAVWLAYSERLLGERLADSARLATGFSGRAGGAPNQTCGALSGGILVIGALLGRDDLRGDEGPALRAADRLRSAFISELGDFRCEPVYASIHAAEGAGSCVFVVKRTVELLLDILEEYDLELDSVER